MEFKLNNKKNLTHEQLLDIKTDEAEKFLQSLAKSYKINREVDNTDPRISNKLFQSSKLKKKKNGKRVKKNKKRVKVADLYNLTMNLQLLEQELENKEKLLPQSTILLRRKAKSSSKNLIINSYHNPIGDNEADGHSYLTFEQRNIYSEKVGVDQKEYLHQFKNYKIKINNDKDDSLTHKQLRKGQGLKIDLNGLSPSQNLSNEHSLTCENKPKEEFRKESYISNASTNTRQSSSELPDGSNNFNFLKIIEVKKPRNRKLTTNSVLNYKPSGITKTKKKRQPRRTNSILDKEFEQFYSAFEDHCQLKNNYLRPEQKSDASIRLCSNSSVSSKTRSPNHSFFSHSTSPQKSSKGRMTGNIGGMAGEKKSGNAFKLFPLPTTKVISVINCLKQIEDEIEDEDS